MTLVMAGYFANAFIGGVSVFWLMLMAHSFLGGGSYAIIALYLAEVWPTGLRASGMGFGYGVGNLGKIISPLGLAVIVGTSNFVKPAATLAAMVVPAMLFLAFWAVAAALAFLLIGVETKGRSIEEIDTAMTKPVASVKASAALAGKPRMAPIADSEIPAVEALGRKAAVPIVVGGDRGGAISIPTADPLAAG